MISLFFLSWVSQSNTIITLLSISPFKSINNTLKSLSMWCFSGAYILILLCLLDELLYHCVRSIFFNCYFFGLKTILSDLNMDTSTFFWMSCPQNVICHSFTLSLCLLLELRWVSWRQHMVGSYFLIHPVILCLLIIEFNPFIFRVIIERWSLSTANFIFCFLVALYTLFALTCVFGLPF